MYELACLFIISLVAGMVAVYLGAFVGIVVPLWSFVFVLFGFLVIGRKIFGWKK